jgi:hypothetical protein
VEAFVINMPDAVGFLLLKTAVGDFGNNQGHRGNRRALTSKTLRETEAEAVAFVVCQAIGLENGTRGHHPRLRWWPPPDEYLLETLI